MKDLECSFFIHIIEVRKGEKISNIENKKR